MRHLSQSVTSNLLCLTIKPSYFSTNHVLNAILTASPDAHPKVFIAAMCHSSHPPGTQPPEYIHFRKYLPLFTLWGVKGLNTRILKTHHVCLWKSTQIIFFSFVNYISTCSKMSRKNIVVSYQLEHQIITFRQGFWTPWDMLKGKWSCLK